MRIGVRLFDVLASFEPKVQADRRKDYPLVEYKAHHADYPQEDVLYPILSQPNFLRDLPEIEGAVEAVKEMMAMGHQVYIFSTPFAKESDGDLQQKFWVDKRFGDGFSSSEYFILMKNRGVLNVDFLINDDIPSITIPDPTWKLVVFDSPTNQQIDCPRRIMSWQGEEWKKVLGI